MSQVATKHYHDAAYDTHEKEYHEVTGWTGWVGFAGFMMILAGMFQAIVGLVGIFKDTYFAITNTDTLLVIQNVQDWGWVNLIAGGIIVLAGIALFTGATWARVIAVLMAMSSAILNLLAISLYPVWAIICLTLSVVVLYAVIVHGGELKET